jgi:L-2-hydroxyglutarate oxidase LhgO
MDQANVLIIGGGVIGCAIAREVSQRWQDVFLVEQFPKLGMATSTRNSGVIHSGIYYPKGSLKARHCVEGNRLSYEFCAKHNVPFRKTGKLVVAANAGEEHELEALAQRGRDNGVEHLTIVGPKEIQAREPHIRGTAPPRTWFERTLALRQTTARTLLRARKSLRSRQLPGRCASILKSATKMACKKNPSKPAAW